MVYEKSPITSSDKNKARFNVEKKIKAAYLYSVIMFKLGLDHGNGPLVSSPRQVMSESVTSRYVTETMHLRSIINS